MPAAIATGRRVRSCRHEFTAYAEGVNFAQALAALHRHASMPVSAVSHTDGRHAAIDAETDSQHASAPERLYLLCFAVGCCGSHARARVGISQDACIVDIR